MGWFFNLKTGVKLALGFGICLILGVVVGMVGLTRMAEIGASAQRTYQDELIVKSVGSIDADILRYNRAQ